ncbi:MAG TPA: polyamine aminopropyltransferase [Rhodocyclaceae bacterium]|nr:polyamine aminopropyltransferase [Rhodocyclaceae bacterium]
MSPQHRTGQPEPLCEDLNEYAGFFIRPARLLDAGRSEYQDYEVWDTEQFGRLFRLDGCFMTSERDEFFYHENLIHVPAVTHPAPRHALIIGGGDGGSAEELFKHPSMEQVVLVELDAKVVEIARTHLSIVHHGALDDPRLELCVEDGLRYVRERAPADGRRFDLIVLDLTDPVGPAEALYEEAFFRDCKALLSAHGALVLHIGAPIFQPQRLVRLMHNLRAVFRKVCPYFTYIPLYGSQWGMACASDTLDPTVLSEAEVDRRIGARGLSQLQYYNGAVHRAQFALPNYLRELLG